MKIWGLTKNVTDQLTRELRVATTAQPRGDHLAHTVAKQTQASWWRSVNDARFSCNHEN